MPPRQRFFGRLAPGQEAEALALRALGQQGFEGVGDLVRLGQASGAELGLGHRPLVGADHRHAVGLQGGEVPLRRRMQPHPHVHRRGDQDRQGGGEQHRRGEVRRVAGRHPRHQVGGGRRHHDGVGVARELDMADIRLALPVEQIGMGPLPGERGRRQRRDEFLGGFGQQRAHLRPALAQAPDQVERLVGGDAAADDEQDAAAGEGLRGRRGHGRRTGICGRRVKSGEERRGHQRPPLIEGPRPDLPGRGFRTGGVRCGTFRSRRR